MSKIANEKKLLMEQIALLFVAFIQTLFVWEQAGQDGNRVAYVFVFVAFLLLGKKVIEIKDKRMWCITSIVSALFTIAEVIGMSINADFTLNHIFSKQTLIIIPGCFLCAQMVIMYVFKAASTQNNLEEKLQKNLLKANGKWFVICMLLIIVAWLPYFLIYFPGLTTADSMDQIYQTIGYTNLKDNHPIMHTLIVSVFMNLGKLFSNYTLGVACYTAFQAVCMAAIFSYAIYYMGKKNFPIIVRGITLLYFMIYPVNALFSMILWKDILFAGIVLLLTLFTHEWVTNTENFGKKNMILYTLVILGTTFLRNNGLYVILLMFPIMLIACRKNWKKTCIIFGTALLLCFGIKSVLFEVFNIENGLAKEALSIPMQQIAKVVQVHENDLSDEEKDIIHKFIPIPDIAAKYNPVISDPIKKEFNNNAFVENKVEFIKLWLDLLIKYPKEYVEAFFSNNYGYWYPEAQHWVANRTMEQDDILHLESKPLIEGKIVKKVDSLIENRRYPLISMAVSIGFVFWLMLVSAFYSIYERKYKYLLIYLPVLLLWLTTLASPVFCEFRYIYGMFTSVPFLIGMQLNKERGLKK